MSYIDSRSRPNLGSMAAVVAIHGAVGVALIVGLTVSGVIKQDDGPIIAIPIRQPPPPKQPETRPDPGPVRKVLIPEPPVDFPLPQPTLDSTTDLLPPIQPPILPPGKGDGVAKPVLTPRPGFAPVAARPRNDPQAWVTTDDYRSNWIRQEMAGRARFRLEIAADGRVADCTITATSGHAALDAATCALVTKRARFQPAQGSDGGAVSGSYTSTIDWRLPE